MQHANGPFRFGCMDWISGNMVVGLSQFPRSIANHRCLRRGQHRWASLKSTARMKPWLTVTIQGKEQYEPVRPDANPAWGPSSGTWQQPSSHGYASNLNVTSSKLSIPECKTQLIFAHPYCSTASFLHQRLALQFSPLSTRWSAFRSLPIWYQWTFPGMACPSTLAAMHTERVCRNPSTLRIIIPGDTRRK